MAMQIDRVAPVSKAVITLLSTSVFIAAFSAAMHSHWDTISYIALTISMTLGFCALLKILNNAASKFFFARVVHWVHAICFEVLAFVGVIFLRLLGFFPFQKTFLQSKPNSKKSDTPILLVHGYCNNSSVWTYIRWRLELATKSPVYAINLGHPFKSMNEYANRVSSLADQIRIETGSSQIILMGHSMGGLITSMVAMKDPVGISSVFTIGSPLLGTHVARVGIGRNAREMQRSSPLLKDLHTKLKEKTKIRFYHIGTKTDQLVMPANSCVLGICPDREFLFEDIGHASLLFSPRVADLLVHWLNKDVKS
ncbi:MAG TPA: alpha/beta fold hydrolase [Chlamydiales bacterium]|jgi:triacylglycerol lipase|nr:alpha/beta fold hydrolase [Chlamydiales bacterium]